jgi:hypothetical protein
VTGAATGGGTTGLSVVDFSAAAGGFESLVRPFCLFWWPIKIARVRLRIKNKEPR